MSHRMPVRERFANDVKGAWGALVAGESCFGCVRPGVQFSALAWAAYGYFSRIARRKFCVMGSAR